ncbi:MAG: class I SAM-dependent methyltransferase [Myxococcota bacterium]
MLSRIPRHENDSAPGTHETNLSLALGRFPLDGRVVDLGAGTGSMSRALRDAGMKVTAVDLRELPEAEFEGIARVNANLDKGVPLPDESFDGAVCQEVAHQVENPWALLREIARVLRPDGHLVLSTPNMYHVAVRLYELAKNQTPFFLQHHYEEAHQMTPLPLWNLERMGAQAGLTLRHHTFNMNYLPGLRLRLPFRTKRFGHTLITVFQKSRAV